MNPKRPLELCGQERARITSDVFALCQEYWDTVPSKPVWAKQDRAALDGILKLGIPEKATPWDSILDILRNDVLPSQAHLVHPRFFAFVSSPSNFVSCLADFLASVHNPFAGNWLEGSGAQTVERALTTWLAHELGLPENSGGMFLSGGSLGNLTALVAARHWRFGPSDDWRRGIVYFSDQTHSSVARALRILGFSQQQIRILPTDDSFRLSASSLQSAINSDAASGWTPFCVVGNAGTTNTGAVDPFLEISGICRRHQIWLHVDGAYGGAAAISDEGKETLQGLHLADSVALDPHKWLFQPFDCGCLLVRDASHLYHAFHTGAEYLQDAEGDWKLWDYGPELTRPFRALKLWLSLQLFGASAFRSAVVQGLHLARYAERQVRALPIGWELLTPASMGILTFRYAPAGASEREMAAMNLDIAERCLSEGFAFVATTQVKGKAALRFCTINPRTTEEDIARTLHQLDELARKG
jgi:aromatic-L-amino-acid/L-tryptophan decarboxylase